MALPSLEKTWQFDLNNRVHADSSGAFNTDDFINDKRLLLYGIKEAMIGFSLNPWTVAGSSTPSAGGMDAVDRWTGTIDNSVIRCSDNDSVAHSWIVLEQSNVGGSGIHILLNCRGSNNADGGLIDVFYSEAGFTGGSPTARPTAVDEVQICNGSTFGIEGNWGAAVADNTARSFVFHVWQSDDGQCTRVLTYYNNNPLGFWIFDTVADPVTGWTEKFVVAVLQDGNSSTASTPTYSVLERGTARLRGFKSGDAGAVRLFFTGESFNSEHLGEHALMRRANQLSNEIQMPHVGVASLATDFIGRHGRMFDLWWGPTHSDGNRDGRTYPASGSTRQFAQFGHLIFPWDGATPPKVI